MKKRIPIRRFLSSYILLPLFVYLLLASHQTARAAVFCSEAGDEQVVICIDAGHGGNADSNDMGCQLSYDGVTIVEKEVDLKLAGFLADELSTYRRVKVVMTRTKDESLSNRDRAARAKKLGAEYVISTHINAADPSWSGPTVLATCSAYQPADSTVPNHYLVGSNLAYQIESSLMDLGTCYHSDRDHIAEEAIVRRRNCEADGAKKSVYYPDGSYADFYGLIRFCKEAGMPAVIVEHAFLTNENDYRRFLSNDDQLNALALQDAKGIANALGLTK